VAAKSLHTDAALAATAGVFADAAVCSVQKGVGNEEIIARYVPRVIRGTTIVAGHVPPRASCTWMPRETPGSGRSNGNRPGWTRCASWLVC
jgi:ketopantoate reductase